MDPPTRHKLETLFNTWMSGLGQGPIFPRDQLATIERALARSRPVGGVHVNPQYMPPQPAYGYPPQQADDKTSLLHDIQTLLVQKNSRLLMRPDDQVNQSQITALNQVSFGCARDQVDKKLRSLIQSTHLNPEQIASTRQQLNSLFEEDELIAPVVQSPYRHTPPPPAALPNLGNGAASAPAGSDLISSLVMAGLLKADSTPATDHSLMMAPKSSSHVSAAIAERDSIRLTNADIQHKRPNVVHLLYGALPLQCMQCGLRFPETDSGKKENQTHLDWHFRQNRRVREGLNRGQSRSWFLAEEDWISFKDTPYEDQPEQERAGSQEPGVKANGSAPAPTNGPSRAELEAKYVVAPTDPEIARQPCPICREMFVSVWNEDDEEWIWKNAVNINGKIYHATCHEDARRSALKDPQRRRSQSRSVTPETSSAKKRKVEEVLPKVEEENDLEEERSAKRVASED